MKLNSIESTILNKIKQNHKEVIMIPIDIYATLLLYSEIIEDYNTCIILRDIEHKVKDATVDRIINK
jgi:hypothetical protein